MPITFLKTEIDTGKPIEFPKSLGAFMTNFETTLHHQQKYFDRV